MPVITSLLAEAVVESAWLISTEPMSGRLPAGQRPCRAELVGGARRQRVGAAQRRVVDAVPQRDDAVGVEQAAAGVGVDRGEDGAGGDVLAIAGGVAGDVAAEDVVAVGEVMVPKMSGLGIASEATAVAGDDTVGDVQLPVVTRSACVIFRAVGIMFTAEVCQ